MPKTYKLQNGEVLRFPDDTTPEEMDEIIRQREPTSAAIRPLGPVGAYPAVTPEVQEANRQARIAGAPQFADPGFPQMLANLASGGAEELRSLATGAAQIGTRIIAGAPATLEGIAGVRGPATEALSIIDDYAANRAQDWQNSAAGQSGAGQVGRLTTGILATSPLAKMAIAAKGAPALEQVRRGAQAGLATAVINPVTEGDFASGKLEQAGLGTILGGGVPATLRFGQRVAEGLLPANMLARAANISGRSSNATPYAEEGENLAIRTGVELTPGQISGNRLQTGLENMSRQSILSGDIALKGDTRIANQAIAQINRLADNITKNPASAESIGIQMSRTVENTVKKIADRREALASQQYGAIRQALGDKPVVSYDATAKALRELIDNNKDVFGADAEKIVRQASAMLRGMQSKQGFSINDAIKSRAYYGRAIRGGTDVFSDISKPENIRMARKLYAAMSEDIEAAANRYGTGPQTGPGLVQAGPGMVTRSPIGDAWREANRQYRESSELLRRVENGPLARLLGADTSVDDFMIVNGVPGEKVVAKLSSMTPSELRLVRNTMESQAPETWQQYKRLIIDDALSQSQASASVGRGVPLTPGGFFRALGGNNEKKAEQIRAIYSNEELREIQDSLEVMRRLGDRFGANSSGTAPQVEVQNMLNTLKNGVAKGAGEAASYTIGMRNLANVIANSNGRRALIRLWELPPQSQQAASLLGYITALYAGKEVAAPKPDRRDTTGK